MNLFQRLYGRTRPAEQRAHRGQLRLELVSLLAVLLVGALAIGATSAGAEEADAPEAQSAVAINASTGGDGETLNSAEQGVVIEAAEVGPVDAEFEACMREQGIELPGPMFHERSEDSEGAGPSFEAAPVDDAFIEAAEQCGHPVETFTHEFDGNAPSVSADEVKAFHECLSAAGIDLPAPEVTAPGGAPAGGAVALHLVVAESDPELRAAYEECATMLPEGVVEVLPEDAD